MNEKMICEQLLRLYTLLEKIEKAKGMNEDFWIGFRGKGETLTFQIDAVTAYTILEEIEKTTRKKVEVLKDALTGNYPVEVIRR